MVIREYDAGDLDACRALWAELTLTHRELYADPKLGGDNPGAGFDAFDGEVWVAEAEGHVVGLVGLLWHGSRAELEPIVVAAAHRGGGIGRALAETAVAAARGAGATRIFVQPTARNQRAIRFFHALGFDFLSYVSLQLDDRVAARTEQFAGLRFRV